jgi:hypothetical protein
MWANYYNAGEQMTSGPVAVEVGDSDVENIGLTIIPPEEIRGQLNFDDEAARQAIPAPQSNAPRPAAAQGASSQAPPPRPAPRIQLREVFGTGQVKTADVSEDGAFTIAKVSPGKFLVVVIGYQAYVKSTLLGTAPHEGPILDLTRGSAGAPLTVTLSSVYGEIAGTVQDDKGPAAGARVVLCDTVGIGSIRNTTITGPDGTYTLKTVTPGAYKLLAIDDSEVHTMTSEPSMDDYDERADSVDVRPKETLTRDLKIRPLK